MEKPTTSVSSGDLRITQKVQQLGEGGTGGVWKVKVSNGEILAAKLFNKIKNVADVQRDMESEKNLFGLSHENIARFVAVIQHEGVPVLLTEFISGQTLSQLRKRRCFEMTELKNYTRQIFRAVAYVHQRNIIHRDLKCSNVMVTGDGVIKLIDFGLSHKMQLVDGQLTAGRLRCCGSLYYFAPEVMPSSRSGPQFSPASDVYALGCILYKMVTGKAPYFDLKDEQVEHRVRRIGPPPLRQVSEEILDFYSKCVVMRPERRLPAAELLKHPFLK